MDLPQGNQPEDLFAFCGCGDKQPAIRGHDIPVIGIGKTQI